ncbi:MAG: vitamin B12-dependent ribonucleotide reductase [bacterium]
MSPEAQAKVAAEREKEFEESRFADPPFTGLEMERRFTSGEIDPFEEITWERRDASITNHRGEVIFEQKDVEVPEPWSQLATNVVISKYFHGHPGTPERETSVKQLVGRVVGTITEWAREGDYFRTEEDLEAFTDELTYLTVNQHMAFNSPVWFNVGVEDEPQCSACFINSVVDSMESILGLAKTEGMLFKFGSGAGSNLSPIRSSQEKLGGGGTASGPVSFMKGFDAFAGVIKSGGKTRRAAKMVILDIDHPDVEEFIRSKAEEEQKAWALIDAGYDGSLDGEAYGSVFFQNANHSVRVTDEFMHAVQNDEEWTTRAVTTGEVMDTFRASDLMREMAEAAWTCGDPGIQYDTTINDWHTCSATDRIHASNPCSEYMFLDDTACNLASLNLMKFQAPDGTFDISSFMHAVRVTLIAQEILVDNASYPTPAIGENSHYFRPLGLGYANLGALLMSRGLAYDSEKGRSFAAAVTSLMHGTAYRTSAEMAASHGPFKAYPENEESMLRVIGKHRDASLRVGEEGVPPALQAAHQETWDRTLELGSEHGFRNSQVTVLAPTGTIAFMMDCDTTGIEPDIALVKYKKLVGGGMLKIVNRTVPLALERLGYDEDTARRIVDYIDENGTIEGAPGLKDEHLSVFDCAFKPAAGVRSIEWMGHIRMMGAVQPFLSGAISKTVNMPNEAAVEDIEKAYMEGWRLGLKALAIYRDGCKRTQPLNTGMDTEEQEVTRGKGIKGSSAKDRTEETTSEGPTVPRRRRLPDERRSITHKFSVGGHEGYINVGMYEDGTPGELFITMAKEGSTISGLMDTIATMTSLLLQYGVPLPALIRKFSHSRFEPSGFTNNREIPIAKSIIDYIFRWLALKFLPAEELSGVVSEEVAQKHIDAAEKAIREEGAADDTPAEKAFREDAPEDGGPRSGFVPQDREASETQMIQAQADAPSCPECGSIMVRNGACYKCLNCGATSGCS